MFRYPLPPSNTLLFAMLKFSVLAALLTLSVASPLVQRDVWDPPVLTPTEGSILVSGTSFVVEWDTSNPPAEITDKTGLIALIKDGFFVTSPDTSVFVC